MFRQYRVHIGGPIAVQFLGTYVIVMGVSNHSGSIKLEFIEILSTHRGNKG